jgi:ribokinase
VPRVLVVGSANVDFTVALARLPQPGETVTNGTLLVNHGGKGANQAVAARRLGAEVRLIGCVGQDPSGREVRAALGSEGVDASGVMASAAAATGTALIFVDAEGRNQIAVAPGANRALTVDHVEARADDFAWAEVLVASCEVPLATVRAALALARRRRLPTILNPAPVPESGLDFLDLVDYLTPNAGEAARLSEVRGEADGDVTRAAEALRARGAHCVLVTLGERGVLACEAHRVERVPASRVTAIDTTAAGDAFNGALAVALTEGRELHPALRFANAAAALTCTRRGAQASLPRRDEVLRLLG